jgi:hypothetical protein
MPMMLSVSIVPVIVMPVPVVTPSQLSCRRRMVGTYRPARWRLGVTIAPPLWLHSNYRCCGRHENGQRQWYRNQPNHYTLRDQAGINSSIDITQLQPGAVRHDQEASNSSTVQGGGKRPAVSHWKKAPTGELLGLVGVKGFDPLQVGAWATFVMI